jgi:2-oxoglutarate dehydrogenase E1 component
MSRQDANAAFARTSFLYGGNAAYVEQLHSRYESNPASVDAEWRTFFESLKDERSNVIVQRPSWKRPNIARQRRLMRRSPATGTRSRNPSAIR